MLLKFFNDAVNHSSNRLWHSGCSISCCASLERWKIEIAISNQFRAHNCHSIGIYKRTTNSNQTIIILITIKRNERMITYEAAAAAITTENYIEFGQVKCECTNEASRHILLPKQTICFVTTLCDVKYLLLFSSFLGGWSTTCACAYIYIYIYIWCCWVLHVWVSSVPMCIVMCMGVCVCVYCLLVVSVHCVAGFAFAFAAAADRRHRECIHENREQAGWLAGWQTTAAANTLDRTGHADNKAHTS